MQLQGGPMIYVSMKKEHRGIDGTPPLRTNLPAHPRPHLNSTSPFGAVAFTQVYYMPNAADIGELRLEVPADAADHPAAALHFCKNHYGPDQGPRGFSAGHTYGARGCVFTVYYNMKTLWGVRHKGHIVEDAIGAKFLRLQRQRGDINEHLGTLRNLARRVDSVHELGVSKGTSSWAFLEGLRKPHWPRAANVAPRLISVDVEYQPEVEAVRIAAQGAGG